MLALPLCVVYRNEYTNYQLDNHIKIVDGELKDIPTAVHCTRNIWFVKYSLKKLVLTYCSVNAEMNLNHGETLEWIYSLKLPFVCRPIFTLTKNLKSVPSSTKKNIFKCMWSSSNGLHKQNENKNNTDQKKVYSIFFPKISWKSINFKIEA